MKEFILNKFNDAEIQNIKAQEKKFHKFIIPIASEFLMKKVLFTSTDIFWELQNRKKIWWDTVNVEKKLDISQKKLDIIPKKVGHKKY